jgi:hypothetical protein
MRVFLVVLCIWTAYPGLNAQEEQSHGNQFEQLVWNHLFQRNYTDKWDIPGEANLINPGIPISVKCIKWKNSIYLGDALRQRQIDHPFELIVGFYQEKDDTQTLELVALHRVLVSPEQWKQWWGSVREEDLSLLTARIRETDLATAQKYARKQAALLRSKAPVISINPKVNKDQRRIQCSIPFTVFYREVLQQEPDPQNHIRLWGRSFPRYLDASPRTLTEGSSF